MACALLLCGLHLHAQRAERGWGTVILEPGKLQLNLLMPGLQYELGLLPNLTVGAEIGLGLATPREGYSLAPAYRAFSRYYHNLKARQAGGKTVSGNSGNYFAITFNHYFTKLELAGNMDNEGRDLIFLGPVYGLQRSYGNGFSFSVDAGAGFYFRNRISSGIGPSVHLRLGWNPFARRKQQKKPVIVPMD
ncbi:hypothetical protein OZ410_07705 [Robiginitalea sp. M366]|uniref:hypothetical protein n=1 Tax=Robiginitalea aestuariiviva TaxID=3036903 RepID=UPI00240E982E|nr:hypothetical protein [Robiginitalea aestuariiviva]MDG1572197.1 hypothetical protein [Robiginitalea aestuariiviva]